MAGVGELVSLMRGTLFVALGSISNLWRNFFTSVNVPICIQNWFLFKNNYNLCIQEDPADLHRRRETFRIRAGRDCRGFKTLPSFHRWENWDQTNHWPWSLKPEPGLRSVIFSPILLKIKILNLTINYLQYLITKQMKRAFKKLSKYIVLWGSYGKYKKQKVNHSLFY